MTPFNFPVLQNGNPTVHVFSINKCLDKDERINQGIKLKEDAMSIRMSLLAQGKLFIILTIGFFKLIFTASK